MDDSLGQADTKLRKEVQEKLWAFDREIDDAEGLAKEIIAHILAEVRQGEGSPAFQSSPHK